MIWLFLTNTIGNDRRRKTNLKPAVAKINFFNATGDDTTNSTQIQSKKDL